ncbi:MAG: copper resistance CopC family protein [Pseudomonadota bacterium]
MTKPTLANRIGATALAFGLLATGALAHSAKMETVPADGARLAEAPAIIGMVFDAPVRVTSVTLENGEGEGFEIERTDGMAPVERFEAGAPVLPSGSYRVEWRGLADDGHPMSGGFGFIVE